MLVSSRSAVWEPAAPPIVPVDTVAEISDPIWDHKGGTRWTPDLVHCRLVDTVNTYQRLPGSARLGFKTLLGAVADREPDPDYIPLTPPSPSQITLADWTWAELLRLTEKAQLIIIGMALEKGVRGVAKALLARGITDITKSTVSRRYMAYRRSLAADWQGRTTETAARVDDAAFNRWRELFENARK
jgi:hypothetical protein